MTTPLILADEILDVCGVVAACAVSVAIPAYPAVRRALSGTLLIGFALASFRVAGGGETAAAGSSATSFAITCGIALLGLFVVVFHVAQAFGRGWWSRATRPWAMLATALALGVSARSLIPLVNTGGALLAPAAAATLFLLGALIRFIGSRMPIGRRNTLLDWLSLRAGLPYAIGGPSNRVAVSAVWIHLAGTAVLLLASHLQLFMVALILAVASGVAVERWLGLRRIPLVTVAAIPALGLSWYLLVQVAGEPALRLSALRDAPYSSAFQLVTSLALALVAWALLRLWPFLGAPRGPLAPLLGGLLFVRLIAPGLPEGLFHWQPVLYLLTAIAACHAAVARRDDEALAALAALGLASGVPAAGGAGLGLATASIVARLVRQLNEAGRVLNRRGRALVATLAVVCSALLPSVLRGALEAQVFYSALTVAALALALWASGSPAQVAA